MDRDLSNYLNRKFIESGLPFLVLDDVAKDSGLSAYSIRKELKRSILFRAIQINPPRGPYIIIRVFSDDEFCRLVSQKFGIFIVTDLETLGIAKLILEKIEKDLNRS